MRIALFTNTYLPHVGGVARSVKSLEDACRHRGHEVRIVAPEFEGAEAAPDVLRVPAIQHFNGSDFSVRLPMPNVIRDFMETFQPDVIHSQHPFLLGDAALREARKMHIPIVFTHHTLYERYTHYVPLDSPALKRVAIQLATEYANLCDQIIAPSASIENLLRERGVRTPIDAIPTGIDTGFFGCGRGDRFRERAGLRHDATVIGHVGRLAREKNLIFLAESVGHYLKDHPESVFLVVGEGDALDEMREVVARATGTKARLHVAGTLGGQDLADAYAAMDCFVFASQSETQGLVLAEAMAAGCPVVALDGPGVREIMRDGINGLLLPGDAEGPAFAAAIAHLRADPALAPRLSAAAVATALEYDGQRCVTRLIACYDHLIGRHQDETRSDLAPWDRLLSGIEIEWNLFVEKMAAAAAAVAEVPTREAGLD